MVFFLLGSLVALVAAAVTIGPGTDRFRRFIRDLEKEYARDQGIPWREVRPILRSATTADEKLTALGHLIGTVRIDPDLFSAFGRADEELSKLERRLIQRYHITLVCATWLIILIMLELALPNTLDLRLLGVTLTKQGLLVALFVVPFPFLLFVLFQIGVLEARVVRMSNDLEETL